MADSFKFYVPKTFCSKIHSKLIFHWYISTLSILTWSLVTWLQVLASHVYLLYSHLPNQCNGYSISSRGYLWHFLKLLCSSFWTYFSRFSSSIGHFLHLLFIHSTSLSLNPVSQHWHVFLYFALCSLVPSEVNFFMYLHSSPFWSLFIILKLSHPAVTAVSSLWPKFFCIFITVFQNHLRPEMTHCELLVSLFHDDVCNFGVRWRFHDVDIDFKYIHLLQVFIYLNKYLIKICYILSILVYIVQLEIS